MVRYLLYIRKKFTAVWLLQTTLVAVAVIFISLLVPPLARAQSQTDTLFMGENPSGKTKPDGSPLHMSSQPSAFSAPKERASGDVFSAECPHNIKCVVVPAAYASNNNDPGNYGNYDKADRPHDMKITSIVIHDTEGSLDSVKQAFQNPTFYASSHYVIDTDGTVYQFVPTKDVAWHAGNWTTNMHSIGIEHVGHAAQGTADYTPAMYRSSVALVNWLASKYDIPRNRQHILGHDNVQAPNPSLVAGMHVDPGPFWNWQGYMARLDGWQFSKKHMSEDRHDSRHEDSWDREDWNGKSRNHRHAKMAVEIAPRWQQNDQAVTGCWPDNSACAPTDPRSTNFIYLRTEPRSDAPPLTDVVLGQGTTDLANTSAKAFYGQTFSVQDMKFEQDGVWYKIWFSGQDAWFFSPWRTPTAKPVTSKYVTPKPGISSVPLYGRPLPEQSDYPSDFTPPVGAITYPTPLQYSITEGQRYEVMGEPVRADHFYAWTIDSSQDQYDHTVFKGKEKYVPVQYNNRFGYVKLSDVVMR